MFRVRGVPGKSSSCVQHGCLLGLFGNSWGFLWDADDSSWESWGAILEPLGAHLGGSGGGAGGSWGTLWGVRGRLGPFRGGLGSLLAHLGALLGRSWGLLEAPGAAPGRHTRTLAEADATHAHTCTHMRTHACNTPATYYVCVSACARRGVCVCGGGPPGLRFTMFQVHVCACVCRVFGALLGRSWAPKRGCGQRGAAVGAHSAGGPP